MKQVKKGLLVLLFFCVLIGVVGCTDLAPVVTVPEVPEPTVDPVKEAYENDPAGFVVFSRSTAPYERYVPIPELLEYETKYPDCNSTWFRDQLSGEDLIIYNSFLYALENRFIGFTMYVEDSSKDFSYIRELVSLDSPFLEQNFSYYEYIRKRPVNYIGKPIYVSMEQFTDVRWEMKMEALAECRRIVQSIPQQYQTQQEKMEYLYDYICDNVEYVEYESMADESYFYDAVCKGQTLCDGYSNMLLLLFRLIDVECCEAMADGEEGEGGHTWVVAKLNGEFYNFDPTFEDSSEIRMDHRRYFGFSDDLVSMKELDYEQMRPKCTDTSRDFIYADIIVNSFTDWDEVKKIAALAEERMDAGEESILVGVTSPVDSQQYDLFFKRFFMYTSIGNDISLSAWEMRNSALIQVNLTPKTMESSES